jgi:signal transduction histidine kinase
MRLPPTTAVLKRELYLLLAFPLALTYVILLVTLLSTGLGLAFTLIGLPILAGTVALWRLLAKGERRLSGALLGTEVPDPYRVTTAPTWWRRGLDRLADPATWKDLAYLVVLFPLSIVYLAVGLALPLYGIAFLTAPAWYWAIDDGTDVAVFTIDTLPEALALMPVGALLLIGGAWAVYALGAGHAVIVRALLGRNRDVELEAQVSELRSSGARIVAAADAERRRLERALHDGAQQRLVSLSLVLGMARKRMADDDAARELVERAHGEAQAALGELRDLARGLHPAILSDRGLRPALEELASRSPIPADIGAAPDERLPEHVEATAYFVVAEALTNVAKYAQATRVTVSVRRDGDDLHVEVADDGVGGADANAGTGLCGLTDRVSALEGRLDVVSPKGQGTRITAIVPVDEAPPPRVLHDPLEASVQQGGQTPLLHDARAARRRRALATHAVVYGIVMTVLIVIWAITTFGYFWPIWPMLGWGAILALHAWFALGPEDARHAQEQPQAAPRT